MRSVLNVGGGSKEIPIPAHFDGWEHLLLDINPKGSPDIVGDARNLTDLGAGRFDAVYCSHNLEHYYKHEARRVLQGFVHILKPDGFAHVRVPEIGAVIRRAAAANLDIEDALYQSPAGPITVHDVLYGYGREIESTGVDFYAHKCGFSERSLRGMLQQAGFASVYAVTIAEAYEVQALAFKQAPTAEQRLAFGI